MIQITRRLGKEGEFLGKRIAKKKDGVGTARIPIPIRLSKYEIEIVEEKAKALDMDRSKYIRQLILQGGKVDTKVMEDRKNLIQQISAIGNNINQSVHLANANEYITSRRIEEILEMMKDVQMLLREVSKQWLSPR